MEGLDGRHHNIQVRDEATVSKSNPSRSLPAPPEFTAADSEELRFTLKELFIATTLAATMLAAFRALGIMGAVLSFLTAVVATHAGRLDRAVVCARARLRPPTRSDARDADRDHPA